jgi:hypothetical protein
MPDAPALPDTMFLDGKVDSAAVARAYLRDYFARVASNDTVRIDTAGITGYVAIADSLRFNRIQIRRATVRLNVPVITNTIRIPAPKQKRWGIGLQGGYGLPLRTGQLQPYIGIGITRSFIRF